MQLAKTCAAKRRLESDLKYHLSRQSGSVKPDRFVIRSLAELARLYGGTGSKSLRFVSTRNAFFGNTLCLSNFRESVNGRALATEQYKKLDRNSG